MTIRALTVDAEGVGRLDRFLRKQFPQAPYGALMVAVRKGRVRVNKKKARFDTLLNVGDTVHTSLEDRSPKPQTIDSQLLSEICIFEDDNFWVCNKPADLSVHAGTRHKHYSLDVLLQNYSKEKDIARIRLVSRLDLRTTGVLVCAKNRHAAEAVRVALVNHCVEKTYFAVVQGTIQENATFNVTEPVVVEGKSMPAETHMTCVASGKHHALLKIRPITGRKRQIRHHCSHIGHTIVGENTKHPLLLHAHTWKMDVLGQNYQWVCVPPKAMLAYICQHVPTTLFQ